MDNNYISDVTDFHVTYGLPVADVLISDHEDVELRRKLIEEEYTEVMCAMKNLDGENLINELADLVYVTIGTAIAMGYDFNEAWRRVHESNMSKLGIDGKPIRRSDGKILKGPNYKKAEFKDLIENATRYVSNRRSALSR